MGFTTIPATNKDKPIILQIRFEGGLMAKSDHDKKVEKAVKWAEKQAEAVKSEAKAEPMTKAERKAYVDGVKVGGDDLKQPADPEFTHQISTGPAGHTMGAKEKTEEEKALDVLKANGWKVEESELKAPEMTHRVNTTGQSYDFTPPIGRPTKYEPRFNEMAKKASSLGATDLDLAELFGVVESTIYLWKAEKPDFSEAIKEGKALIDDMVEKSLLNRALGLTVKETKVFCYEGAIIKEDVDKYFPPDVAAQKHWLNNRRPKDWRDKREVDFTSPLSIVMNELDQGTL
jgi:hypothetical protein